MKNTKQPPILTAEQQRFLEGVQVRLAESPEELSQMKAFFGCLPEWRTRQPDFPLCGLVAVTLCALLCKVCLGQRDLAGFARNLTRDQMKPLGFPRDWSSRIHRYTPPSESTFARLLWHLDNQALQRALLRWLDHLPGQRDPKDNQVSADGKELLNSQGAEVVSAYSVQSGRGLGSEAVAEGSNEIPAIQRLLRRVDLEGSLVTADALNTQTETAMSGFFDPTSAQTGRKTFALVSTCKPSWLPNS